MSPLTGAIVEWKEVRKAFFASLITGFAVALAVSRISVPGLTSSLGDTSIGQAIYQLLLGLGVYVVPNAISFALTFMIPVASGNQALRSVWGALMILIYFEGPLLNLPSWIQEGRLVELLVKIIIFGGLFAFLCWLWDRKKRRLEPVSEESEVYITRSWPVLGTAFVVGALAACLQSVLTFFTMKVRMGGVEIIPFLWEQHWKALPGDALVFGVMLGCLLPSRSKPVYRWLIGAIAISIVTTSLGILPSTIDALSAASTQGGGRSIGEWGVTTLIGIVVNLISLWFAIMLYLLLNPEEKISDWSERLKAKRHQAKIDKAREWLRED